MPLCPNCQQPMRIGRADKSRAWSCRKMGCIRSSGSYISIPNVTNLSIAEMAEDMALGFFNSSADQAKQQATFRRLAGGLNKLESGKKYLSDPELQTIRDAARVLERLGSAAERAKKEKKRLEKEKEQREAARKAEAKQFIAAFSEHDNVMDIALNALTLSDIHATSRYDQAFNQEDLQSLIKHARPEQLLTSIENKITRSLQAQINKAADTISWQDQSVSDCIKQLRVKFNEHRETCRSAHRDLLADLQTAMTVESSDKIERLKTNFKKTF